MQYWSGSLEKSQSYKASIQYWATIGSPAERHLNGPLLVIFGSSLPSSTEKQKNKQRCQSWNPLTKLSGFAHLKALTKQVLVIVHTFV